MSNVWVITYKGRPATKKVLEGAEKLNFHLNETGRQTFIASTSQKACKRNYLTYTGYTWKERALGVDCMRLS